MDGKELWRVEREDDVDVEENEVEDREEGG